MNKLESTPSAFEVLFFNIANICGGDTVLEKRWLAAMTLATVFTMYLASILSILEAGGIGVGDFVEAIWPWSSDNVRSFKGIGFAYLLLLWLPLLIFWLWIGRACEFRVILEIRPSGMIGVFFLAWFFLNVVGVLYINIGIDLPVLAVVIQTIGFILLVAWFRKHPVI